MPEAKETQPGASFSLLSLRPKAQPEHSPYVEFLTKALKDDSVDAPKNIALSGGYGTGKSSILQEVASTFEQRVVRVSFSTLGASREHRKGDDRQETELDSVQKEIVKQILYTATPGQVPASRFQRLDGFPWIRAMLLSATLAAVVAVIVYATDASRRLETALVAAGFYAWVGYLIGIVLMTITGTGIQFFFQNVRVGKVSTASASIELAESSQSYFDQYLDEIVYFFQQSRRDIVLLEDLDRFANSSIFEELRELNTLLNGAKQVGRPVKFVYAVKDALFESWPDGDPSDLTQSAAVRRTKFFDLVVPVVPFIGQRSAREYLTELVEGAGIEVPDPLLAVVARRLPEMRLLKNVVNEYSVFARVAEADNTQGFDNAAERFAMVVFKNVRPKDFEAIHLGNASLNRIYESSRRIIVAETGRLGNALADLGQQSALSDARKNLASDSGREMAAYVSRVLSVNFTPGTEYAYTVGGVSHNAAQIGEPAFWDALYRSADKVVRVEANGMPAGEFRIVDLKRELRLPSSGEEWSAEGRERLEEQRAALSEELAQIRHASFASLVARTDLIDTQTTRSLADLATEELGQDSLAFDLVASGYIDQHFNLYVTRFKGLQLTAEAATYLSQTIELRKYDPEYGIGTGTAVEALIDQAGGEFLGEASALNIDIFDAMLGKDALEPAIRRLAAQGSTDPFIALYLKKGAQPELLVKQLARTWPGIFRLTAEEPTGKLERHLAIRLALENANPDIRYERSDRIAAEIVSGLESLTANIEPWFGLEDLGTVLARLEVEAADLAALPSRLGRRLVELGSYRMSEANLKYAADSTSISLEELQKTSAFSKVVSDLPGYLSLLVATGNTSIREVGELQTVLKSLFDAGLVDVQGVLEQADPSVVVSSWTQIAESQRPSAVASLRISSDFDLIEDYVIDFGLDGPMAKFLEGIRTMPQYTVDNPPQSRRRAIAIRIVNSSMPVQSKLSLFESLHLESPLDIDSLTPVEPDDLAAYLHADVLNDNLLTWGGLKDWPTKQVFLEHTTTIGDWISLAAFSDSDIESLFAADADALDKVKRLVFEGLDSASLDATSWSNVMDFSERGGLVMKDDVLTRAASAGADPARVLRALVKVDRVPEAIQAVLDELGGDYAKVARPGHGQYKFPKDATHRALGEMLDHAEILNVDDADESLKFNLRHPK